MPFFDSRHLLSTFLLSTFDFLVSTLDFFTFDFLLSTLEFYSPLSTFRYTRLTFAQLRSAGHISLQANVWPVQIRTRESCSITRTLNLSKNSKFGIKRKEFFSRFHICFCIFNLRMGCRFMAASPELDQWMRQWRNQPDNLVMLCKFFLCL